MNRRILSYGVAFLSGLAGLGYEIVWTRIFAVGLGHEMPAVLAVVSAFFCGMAAGSWFAETVQVRTWRPGRLYIGIELLIGCWSLATVYLIPWANGFVAQMTGPVPSPLHQWSVAFLIPFTLLFPATCAMGATLPVMIRILPATGRNRAAVAPLYAANTFGAVTGTLLATFILIPHVGYSMTLIDFAVINVFCAVTVMGMGGHYIPAPVMPRDQASYVSAGHGRPIILLLIMGMLGIGYEVLVVRLMSQIVENTVYSFASALVVYLLGTALGAALYHRVAGRHHTDILPPLFTVLSLCCLGGMVSLLHADTLYRISRTAFGADMAGSIAAEMMLAATAFFLPTMVMGAIFSHLAENARAQRHGLGAALSINTLGSALAPLLVGVILVPLAGIKTSFILVSLGYLLLIPLNKSRAHWTVLLPMVFAADLGLGTGQLRLIS